MVDLDTLATLDSLIWLQTGEEVGQRFQLNQSSVSRNQRKCAQAEWHVLGDPTLLNLERPLRLEATYWSGPLLCTPTPPGWVLGLCNIMGIARNLQLVRERIVDAWLCGLPDLPDPLEPDLTAIVLSTMPVHCTVADFPSLALPEGAYPKVEEGLTESAATIGYATALSLELYCARYPEIRLVG